MQTNSNKNKHKARSRHVNHMLMTEHLTTHKSKSRHKNFINDPKLHETCERKYKQTVQNQMTAK